MYDNLGIFQFYMELLVSKVCDTTNSIAPPYNMMTQIHHIKEKYYTEEFIATHSYVIITYENTNIYISKNSILQYTFLIYKE